MYTRHTELRRLHERDEYNLALKLNERDCWRLMEIIPHQINAQKCSNNGTLDWQQAIDSYGRKYRHEHFELMKNAFRASGGTRLVSQILLDEWKTSGRKEERPTLGVLLQLLVGAECWMAADFLATELLHELKPERPLDGPAARFHFPISEICADVEDYVNNASNYPDTEALANSINGFSSINNNNRDYRSKFMLDKHMNMTMTKVPPEDSTTNNSQTNDTQGSAKSTQSTSETIKTHDIPLISSLMTKESSNIGVAVSLSQSSATTDDMSTDTLPGSSTSTTSNSSSSNNKPAEVYTFLSEAPIPNLSILSISANDKQSTTDNITEEILPVLSDLYINGEHDEHVTRKNDATNTVNRDHISSDESSCSSSLSNDEDDDQLNNVDLDENERDESNVDCQSVPNLSIFEQHSSNNDSSLTSVTGTSGENSFEQSSVHEDAEGPADLKNIPDVQVKNSMEIETSDSELPSQENIPCLSALRH